MTVAIQSPAGAVVPERTAKFILAFVAGTAAIVALVVAGTAFIALAIAFPIAVPLADQFNLRVDPSDVALAQQFASMWWLFAIASVASFAAALATVVEIIRRVSPVDPR